MNLKRILFDRQVGTFVQFFRYVIVGGGATVVQYVILIILKESGGFSANLANAFGFFGGLIVNYLISTYWVFDESKVKNKVAEFGAFAFIGVVGLGINQAFIWFFDQWLVRVQFFHGLVPLDKYYLIGQVIATAVAFLWNFCARKYLLYSAKD